MLKKQICDRLKDPDCRINKNNEGSLSYVSFSWQEAVSCWWSNLNLRGLSIMKKISALSLEPFLFIPWIKRALTRLRYRTAPVYGKQSKWSLPGFILKGIKWPLTQKVRWLHPKMKSRKIKVHYLNICFPQRSLHLPVAVNRVFLGKRCRVFEFRQAMLSL